MDGDLRSLFRKHLPEFHWVSIESWVTGAGIPDANYCCSGVEGWIEFKKTTAIAVRFKPGQIAWHEQRGRAGGRTFIAVRRLTRKVDDLSLYPGETARPSPSHLRRRSRPLAMEPPEGPPPDLAGPFVALVGSRWLSLPSLGPGGACPDKVAGNTLKTGPEKRGLHLPLGRDPWGWRLP